MSIVIDLSTARDLLVRVVKEFGYSHIAKDPRGGVTGCIYVTDSTDLFLTPVCIVGVLFARIGIARALIVPGGGDQYGACNFGEGLWDRAEEMGVEFTGEAKEFLRDVQKGQDNDEAWGYALAKAVEKREDAKVRTTREAYEASVTESERILASLPQRV